MKIEEIIHRDDVIPWRESPNWTGQDMTEEDWNSYLSETIEDEYTERDYLVSYYDMGAYGEQVVRACDEEFAIDAFLTTYQSKNGCQAYVARCETLYEAKGRIAAGDTELPEDCQFERYSDCNDPLKTCSVDNSERKSK